MSTILHALLWLYSHVNMFPGLMPDLDWLLDEEGKR